MDYRTISYIVGTILGRPWNNKSAKCAFYLNVERYRFKFGEEWEQIVFKRGIINCLYSLNSVYLPPIYISTYIVKNLQELVYWKFLEPPQLTVEPRTEYFNKIQNKCDSKDR
jgi:hypothetical protein